jgi:hypothetical protein
MIWAPWLVGRAKALHPPTPVLGERGNEFHRNPWQLPAVPSDLEHARPQFNDLTGKLHGAKEADSKGALAKAELKLSNKTGRDRKAQGQAAREVDQAERVNDFAPHVVMNLVSNSAVVAVRFCRSLAG